MKAKEEGKKSAHSLELAFKVFVMTGLVALMMVQFRDKGDAIVYVNAVRLVNEYKGMQHARKEYETKANIWKSNVDSLRIEFENRVKEYQTQHSKLSAREKLLMEELLQNKQEQYVNYQRVIAEKIQKEEKELATKVLGKVNDHIKKYGEEKGYEIIFAATEYGNIVYANAGKDITDELLLSLNKGIAR